jgi:hypothetical protein
MRCYVCAALLRIMVVPQAGGRPGHKMRRVMSQIDTGPIPGSLSTYATGYLRGGGHV